MAIDLSAFGIKTKPTVDLSAFKVTFPGSNSGSTPSLAKVGTPNITPVSVSKYLFNPKAKTEIRPLLAEKPVSVTGPRALTLPAKAGNMFTKITIESVPVLLNALAGAGEQARAFITNTTPQPTKPALGIPPERISLYEGQQQKGKVDPQVVRYQKYLDDANKKSPTTPTLNKVMAYVNVPLNDVLSAFVVGDLAKMGTKAILELTKSSPVLGIKSATISNLPPREAADFVMGRFKDETNRILKGVQSKTLSTQKAAQQLGQLARETKRLATGFGQGEIPQLNTLGNFLDDLSIRLNTNIELLGTRPLGPGARAVPFSETLPGYRPTGGVVPQPFGLSTNPVEPVGFGDDIAKRALEIKKTIKDADAIAAVKIDASIKDMIFSKGDILKPEFAKGRIDDVAQKLNSLQPGLGEVFRQGIDVNKTTFKELVTVSNKLVDTLIKGKPTISPAVAGIRPALSEIFKQTSDPLLQEARKYKTAEEFVKAQSDPLLEFKTLKTIEDPDIARGTVKEAIDDIGGVNNVRRGETSMSKLEATERINTNSQRYKTVLEEVKSGKITPIIADENLRIIDGHHRLEAYREIGIEKVPVIVPKITPNVKFQTKSQLTDIWERANKGTEVNRFDLARQARDKYVAESLAEERPFKIQETMGDKAPEEVLTEYKKDIIGYQESGLGRINNPQPVNAALTRLDEWKDLEVIKKEVQKQIEKAINNGDIKVTNNGDLIVYRVGRIPTENRLTSVTFSKDFPEKFITGANPADKTIREFKIKPNEVGVFIGGDESELLVSSKSLQPKIGEIQPKLPPQKGGLSPELSSRPVETKNVSSLDTTTTSNAVKAITEALKKAKPIRGKQEALYSAERARRIGTLSGMKAKGEQGFFQQLGVLKGELPKAQFESIRKAVTQENIDELFNIIENANITIFEKISAKNGLARLLGAEGGVVPTKGELELLSEIFPPEFIKSILDQRPLLQKLWGGFVNALNLPRAVMATADLSAPLRQGIFLAGRPTKFLPAFGAMFKYAFSEKAYLGLMAEIRSRPTYLQMRENKLALTDMSEVLTAREEAFMSNIAEKIPGFKYVAKGSNRAYSGFLNKLRADVFDDLLKKSKELGIDRPNLTRDIARFVNSATGRGELPNSIKNATQVLNAIFFSPRLMASRINLLNPVYYVTLDPFVRKEALKSLLTFAGIGATIIGLASMAGLDVGTDPRSTDFGKLKTGDTRYDPWGGFQQYIVMASRLITGKMVSSTTGREFNLGEGYKPTTRQDILQRFFENKTSPVASFALALLKGQTATGEAVNVPAEVIDRFLPMLAQDIFDLVRENGLKGVGMAIPGVFGVGSQTYADQVPMKGKTASGRDNIKWRQAPSLGETILNKATGKEITTIPENERASLVEERLQDLIHEANLDRAKKIVLETGKEMTVDGTRVYLDDGIVKTKTSKTKSSTPLTQKTTSRPSLDDIFQGSPQKRPTLESIFSQ